VYVVNFEIMAATDILNMSVSVHFYLKEKPQKSHLVNLVKIWY